ncbi:molybdopterin cofactor-binding domain-containing protein [Roseobacter weihaiensis]|uniref:molybdopterin cofactor-binding domain-containing protein n=1 Tax=Roseobacter weihaiensis TaxID=2763262 RepID=UPI001D09E2DC|nr:molybdopterin cofactor-binding domain-containing protein [Roseobacter sp. H9]
MSLTVYPFVRDWLRVAQGRLVLRTGKVDIGQRISTALMRIAAEELSLPIDRIDVAPVRTGDSPDEGITSGSNSIQQTGQAQRLACATARGAALLRAAEGFGVDVAALDLAEGLVRHRGSNKQISVLDLLSELADDLKVDPEAPSRALNTALGDAPPRGLRAMVEGTFAYLHDLERPGMLHARIVRPPVLDAVLIDIDPDPLHRAQAAGLQIIRDGSFLAVAGTPEWAVVRGAEKLSAACNWDIGTGLETGDVFEVMAERDAERLTVVNGFPETSLRLPEPIETPDFEATFKRPYTLHGALAPSAALAEFKAGQLEILTHSQGIYPLRDSIADSLAMAPEDVVVEHAPGSGCYGHNAADDVAFETALIARALPDRPVLLKYTRADEHAREPVGPAMAVSVRASLDDEGEVAALWMEARGDTFRGRPRAGPNRAGAARLAANRARDADIPRFVPEPNMNRHAGLHRNLDPIYAFADKRLVKALVPDLPLRSSALRCLGATANILALESMMDSLAGRAGADPISYRQRHLEDRRAAAVLDRLQDMLKRPPFLGEGAGRGIAYAQYKNAMTRVGVAVDLTVQECGAVRLDHVRLAADAGRVVDADGLRAQLEGGVLQGASWALHEEVHWGPSGRETLDWDSYPVLRFDEVPKITIEVIGGGDAPSVGAGEASPPPTVAAIANGIFAATGLRLYRLPLNADAIMTAALQE